MSELAGIIKATGVLPGDTVYLHVDLRRLGLLRDNDGRIRLRVTPKALFEALYEVIGKSGTIVTPSYSYSWSRGQVYSLKKSPGTMGIFSEYVRKHPGSERSTHPILSLVSHGAKAKWLFENVGDAVYGENTPYARLCELNAVLLMVGVPYCSIKDHVEALLKVPYRYQKRFTGTVEIDGREQRTVCSHFVRFHYEDQKIELGAFLDKLTPQELDNIVTVVAEDSEIHAIRAQNAVAMLKQILSRDPYRFVTLLFRDRAVFDVLHKLNGYKSHTEGWRLNLEAEQGIDGETWRWLLTRPNRAALNAVGWKDKTVPASMSLCIGGERTGSEISIDTVQGMRPDKLDDSAVLNFISRLSKSPMAYMESEQLTD